MRRMKQASIVGFCSPQQWQNIFLLLEFVSQKFGGMAFLGE